VFASRRSILRIRPRSHVRLSLLVSNFCQDSGRSTLSHGCLKQHLKDRDPRPSMKTSVLKKPSRSTHQTRTQSTEDYWIDAALEPATSTQDPWLIAHSQNLRAPLMAMGSMLDLMELRQKLACVRPLYEEPPISTRSRSDVSERIFNASFNSSMSLLT
jgi:hypothetical protein